MAPTRRARATNDGVFAWADSQDADFASSAANQFLVRASGGAVKFDALQVHTLKSIWKQSNTYGGVYPPK